MPDRTFFDSNIIVYTFDDASGDKKRIASELLEDALRDETGVVSFQVIQETLYTLDRKFGADAHILDLLLQNVLSPMWEVYPSLELYRQAMRIHFRYGFGFYDSLIVAAALEAGCTHLYTEDLQHWQQIEGLTIHNPFAGQ